jgi:hypothetical protein
MRQTGILLLTGIVTSMSLSAQGSRPVPGVAPASQRDFVVIGCIQKTAQGGGDLSITDFRGSQFGTFLLDSKDERLKPWINDTVEIHGPLTPTSQASAPNALMKLSVDKLFVISRGCKLSATK